jgi:pyruvate-formate lyase
MKKPAALIRLYFAHNGKHIQFNVVGKRPLIAQNNPEITAI